MSNGSKSSEEHISNLIRQIQEQAKNDDKWFFLNYYGDWSLILKNFIELEDNEKKLLDLIQREGNTDNLQQDIDRLYQKIKNNFIDPELESIQNYFDRYEPLNADSKKAHIVFLGRLFLEIANKQIFGQDFVDATKQGVGWLDPVQKLCPTVSLQKLYKNPATTINNWKTKFIEWKDEEDETKKEQLGGEIQKLAIMADIAAYLEFPFAYWEKGKTLDNEVFQALADRLKNKIQKPFAIDYDKYKPSQKTVNNFVGNLNDALKSNDLPGFFADEKNIRYLTTDISSEEARHVFLILYENAQYRYIKEYIISRIFHTPLFQEEDFLYYVAHYLASEEIGDYSQAFRLLERLEKRNADIETSLLSNMLRNHYRSTMNINKLESLLANVTNDYQKIFDQSKHYYPGINYAYMLYLGQKLFSDNKTFQGDSIDAIYDHCKTSIDNEKSTQNPYYAVISDLEFQALLSRLPTDHKTLINDAQPTRDMLLRTLRQLNFVLKVRLRDETGFPDDAKDLQTLQETLKNILGIVDEPFAF